MLHRIRQYLALNRTDRRSLRRAFIWLTIADLVLRTRRFQSPGWWLEARTEGRVDAQALRQAENYAHWLEVAARHHFVRARCLHRSLALQQWLRCEGLPSQLQIGVRTVGRRLQAHAWIELGGYTVNDSATAVATFSPLSRPDLRLGCWAGIGASDIVLTTGSALRQKHQQETRAW